LKSQSDINRKSNQDAFRHEDQVKQREDQVRHTQQTATNDCRVCRLSKNSAGYAKSVKTGEGSHTGEGGIQAGKGTGD
jgi:hypothetical protein